MKPHSKDDPYSLHCSPGVAPRLNWKNLAPVDWSSLPRLKSRPEELWRFKTKWEKEHLTLKLPRKVPALPIITNHVRARAALKEMRKTTGLPLKEFVDWRGVTRDAEDALSEYYVLARRYCTKMRGTGAKVPKIGKGYFPNLKQNGYPERELERAADYLGSRVAYRNRWLIGPKAKPWRGLGDADFSWLEKQYPGEYWKLKIESRFMRWHLNNRAEWSYKVASVQIRRSELKENPAPSYNQFMYNQWVLKDFNDNRKDSPIDTPIDQPMLDELARLDAAFEAHRADYDAKQADAEDALKAEIDANLLLIEE
jgi:hypothetical protein